jgi:DNA-binding MarR family transcriptional regulator
MDRTTLGRNLKPLEKKRLIRIETGEDKRERLVYMTERGQELLMKVYAAWKKAQYELLESLGDERLSRLLGDLSAVVKAARRAGEV